MLPLLCFLLQTSGEQLYLGGKFEDARDQLSQEIRAGSATPQTYFWLAYTQLALGDKPGAILPFETYLKSNPNDEDVLYALARTYAQLAEISLQQIFAIDPKCARAYQMRGIRHEIEKDWTKAIEQYRTALKLDPGLRGVHASIARIYEKELGAPEQARIARAREPRAAAPSAGIELVEKKQPREALPHLLQWRTARPGDSNVYYYLGEAYTDLKVAAVQRLRAANPESYRLHQIMAENYASIHQNAEAAAEYRKVLAAQPTLPGAHYELGKLLTDSAPDEACRMLEQELDIDPSHYLAKSLLGQLLAALHEQERAIPLLEEALAARPGLLDAHKALGRALVESGKTESGLEQLRMVAKQSPEDEQIHFLLAQAYRALGQEEDAAREMRVNQETLRKLAVQ